MLRLRFWLLHLNRLCFVIKHVLLMENSVTEFVLKYGLCQILLDSVLNQRHFEHLVHCWSPPRVDLKTVFDQLVHLGAECGRKRGVDTSHDFHGQQMK